MPDATPPSLQDLVLSSSALDRDALRRCAPHLLENLLTRADTRVLELRGDRAPVDGGGLAWRAPDAADQSWYVSGGVVLYLGRIDGVPALAVLRPQQERDGAGGDVRVPEPSPQDEPGSEPAQWVTLRESGLDLDPVDVAALTTAVALAHWHTAHPRCPRCGERSEPRDAGWVRECPQDGSHHFPRTDPAVIMAVVDENSPQAEEHGSRLLLARGTRWRGNHRSVLAGFVEPGESFETAVARETFEESGVIVDAVRYLGNQPWPFPASLMVGFVASARTVELTAQEGEIEALGWYTRADVDAMPADGAIALPGRLSIARSLIEHWYGGPLPEGATPQAR